MNNEIETFAISIVIKPRPAILLTYCYLDKKRRKRLMPIRNNLSNIDLDDLKDLEIFDNIINDLKRRHKFYLNCLDHDLLLKIIIILCELTKNRSTIDQCLSNAERLIDKFKDSKTRSSDYPDLKENGDRKNGDRKIDKTVKRQVHFSEKHEEFFFERFESDDELIDDMNDKDFIDSMFKNDFNGDVNDDLNNNNYQSPNYNSIDNR